ncbi:Kunitz/Bovine pancreatic trypsin inhibitor domain protein [Oesophagostomum dentatum]|uniref:Kunitz/Bovine pancreatic trypsin inhibitor domain protein n=1 Tax=Oesophagostomum dentatum TaxID=61180 RepID=A0A0B1S3W9_OESDE|nr:Kunitz/Bovine pancreatic trypsin inhibitor domain protein [Oesophagostomum dentatum]
MRYQLYILLCFIACLYQVQGFDVARCNAPTHLPGPQCMAMIRRFTFNKQTGTCEMFIYGGCNPSPNNFETYDECMKVCELV